MGQRDIQLRLEPTKGIPSAHVLMGRWKSIPKQLKIKLTSAPVTGEMEMLWEEVEAIIKKALPGIGASRSAGKSYPNRKSNLNSLNTLSLNTLYQIERKFYKLTKIA